MLRIGIVAGEPSGDQLGASLIEGLRAQHPHLEILGMAGPRMRAAGCQALASTEELSVMGLVEVLRHYPRLRRLRQTLLDSFLARKLDIFIGIDVPDFVLAMEQRLKESGVPTVHLVCPQVWAWRAGRLPAMRKAISCLLTLFPFEAGFLQQHGMEARFIGHPLADRIPLILDRAAARRMLGGGGQGSLIALLPGSRPQEYRRHLPLFLGAARLLDARRPGCRFVLGLADARAAEVARTALARGPLQDVQVVVGRSLELLAAADAALCVSGTITLEAALSRAPLVVAYRMPWLSHQILRRLVRVPHIALPNLLFDEPCVPEFIQAEATPARLAAALESWLDEPLRVATYRARCAQLHATLRRDAGRAAAAEILALCAGAEGRV